MYTGMFISKMQEVAASSGEAIAIEVLLSSEAVDMILKYDCIML